MPKTDWLLPRDGEFRDWLEHASGALPGLKTTLGLGDADTTTLTADYNKFKADLTALDTTGAAYDAAAKTKKADRTAIEARVRALVRRIKASAAYTDAIGAQLHILGTDSSTDMSSIKPTLTATIKPNGMVELAFPKGKSDGVNIYTQRDGDATWVFLARDTESPYVDTRPLLVAGKAEVRRYRAVYVLGDDEVGLPSDEISVAVGP